MTPEPTQHQVSVIIAARGRLEFARLCVESLVETTAERDLELIVVDVGSNEGASEYLATIGAKVIHADADHGLAAAFNAGAEAAANEFMAFADSDILFSMDWWRGLQQGFVADDVWAVTPLLSRAYVPADFGSLPADMLAQPLIAAPSKLLGGLFVLRRVAYARLGPFDEDAGLGPDEDLEYGHRIAEAGKAIMQVHNVCVHSFLRDDSEVSAPDPALVRELIRPPGASPVSEAAPRIIACVNVFDDKEVLPDCLASLKGADRICVVDGAYAAYEHGSPRSTDGTLEYLEELRRQDPRIEIVTRDDPWPDEAAKRSAYFIGRQGDWYLVVDADERLYSLKGRPDPVAELRDHLAACPLDAHALRVVWAGSLRAQVYTRVFRHQDGIRYEAAHWNVVAGDLPVVRPVADAAAPLHAVALLHAKGVERIERRRQRKAGYYRELFGTEAKALEELASRLEDKLAADPGLGYEYQAAIWAYRQAAQQNRARYEASKEGT